MIHEAAAQQVAHTVLPHMVPKVQGFVGVRDAKNHYLHYGLVSGGYTKIRNTIYLSIYNLCGYS